MQWIKASERLPIKDDYTSLAHVVFRQYGRFSRPENINRYTSVGVYYNNHHNADTLLPLNLIEWLDESSQFTQPAGVQDATNWVIEYDNDTGANDDYFVEWFNVTNGGISFKCNTQSDADYLLSILNHTTPPPLSNEASPTPEGKGYDIAIEALKNIADPLKYLQDTAEKEGGKLNGAMAIQLIKDVNWLQDFARKALSNLSSLPTPSTDEQQ